MADVKWCMCFDKPVKFQVSKVLSKQTSDALEGSTSGDRALSVFMYNYLQIIKLNSFSVNPLQINSAVFVFI